MKKLNLATIMVFKITFKVLRQNAVLPYSYQYELSAWIYKMIADSNSQLATFLHNKGYTQGFKNFKLFTFSNLYLPQFNTTPQGLEILSPTIDFTISFLVDQAAESMIKTLFEQHAFILGNKHSQVPLQVESIHTQPFSIDSNTLQFRTTSPLVVSNFEVTDQGNTQAKYLPPTHNQYEALFFKNLLAKYKSALQHQVIVASPGSNCTPTTPMHFKLLDSRVRSKLIEIKTGKASATKVRGYLFDFELTAPQDLLKVGYLSGFGGQSAMGFGACKILK
ncbi:CRISPR-associated endoribonuclease Cas6 [uncultured Microscilla sp.]|uniref:CRISPR-associated endoribonuclease Cas6 n=1 Tax=uncultured Microscilla sp. TaxID=432653 RepID=UPI0026379C28|nr:CRISPR-associated endoribonuclease Cas6 [uncultured Microscilla sp.]